MDNKTYPVTLIAKYLLMKSKEDSKPITQLKLQKILYYAQGWYLANFNKPLFNEKIKAWKFGPAVDEIYQNYKVYGNQPITMEIENEELSALDSDTKDFLDEIWKVYKPYSGGDLVTSTHLEDPWNEARRDIEEGENSDNEISKESIKEFFKKKLNGRSN
ncbi:hypothetical protein COV24_03000 [candidate division WWE3 bacterium CG10_big_fil_rev_8_21_14_0_10_32_10]|uniref:Antitoxin SocA-like Panacea domain-containing protein n=1 Tax=candidate division WWE3 bacterium CG10_big_fil_rev_8_21_14_0_10_32_10 TaxID=1975090 RepID=A0A2H0RA90_UNCKA|nr:MAG: hypothetical protein COV24_03000 [candidate division WWE3 bacterium CG10_big_fil_rev_8_21_14_0_10_32_10]